MKFIELINFLNRNIISHIKTAMFTKFIIDPQYNVFQQLLKTIDFEDIANGRKGAIIVDYKNDSIPIVRTTTIYNKPVQKFEPICYDIIELIKKTSNINNLEFNNAMVEIYDSRYRTMRYHSDQLLDLANDSYICLFSCYEHPIVNDTIDKNLRKLVIKKKYTNGSFEIVLNNNSIVIFSTKTNSEHLHKKILESKLNKLNKSNKNMDNRWLGITFRLSKTFVQFINNKPIFFPSNIALVLANEEQRKEFYRLRGLENLIIDYKYPYSEINYTISMSDIMNIHSS